MAFFDDMSRWTYWPNIPAQPFLPPKRIKQAKYIQDMMGKNDAPNRPDTIRPNTLERYEQAASATDLLLGDALLWPVESVKEHCPGPFLMAGASGLLLTPMWNTEVTVGAALLTGYFAGALAYVAKNYRNPQSVAE